jgi:hypothetical protein
MFLRNWSLNWNSAVSLATPLKTASEEPTVEGELHFVFEQVEDVRVVAFEDVVVVVQLVEHVLDVLENVDLPI